MCRYPRPICCVWSLFRLQIINQRASMLSITKTSGKAAIYNYNLSRSYSALRCTPLVFYHKYAFRLLLFFSKVENRYWAELSFTTASLVLLKVGLSHGQGAMLAHRSTFCITSNVGVDSVFLIHLCINNLTNEVQSLDYIDTITADHFNSRIPTCI